MSDPLNPYAPPSAESSALKTEPIDGSLWRVKDGRLLVRNGATLPEVCIFGTQPSDDNPISPKRVVSETRWGWMFSPFFLFPGFWVVIVYKDFSWKWVVALLVAGLLPSLLRKKAKITIWSSDAVVNRLDKWRAWIGIGIGLGIVPLTRLDNVFEWLGMWGFPLILAIFFLGMDLFSWLSTRRNPRLLPAEEGWYELKNIQPHTLSRFEEIQRQASVDFSSIKGERPRQ